MSHWLDKVVVLLQAQTSNLRELAELAGEDPRTFYQGVDPRDLEIEGQDLSGMEFGSYEAPEVANDNLRVETSKLISNIAKTARHEERIALILALILRDRESGLEILGNYQNDRAKFAAYALREIRSSLSKSTVDRDQYIVASMVSQFFSSTFPMNRGRLLYFLAKHLAPYPIVNEAIRVCLRKTESMFVDDYRDRIERALRGAD